MKWKELLTNKEQVIKRYPGAYCRKEKNVGPGYVTMYAVYLSKSDKLPEYSFSAAQAWEFTLNLRILPQRPLLHHACSDCGLRLGLGEIHECDKYNNQLQPTAKRRS